MMSVSKKFGMNSGGIERLKSRLYPDGLVEDSFRKLGLEWFEGTKNKLFGDIVSTNPGVASIPIRGEKIKVKPKERQKIVTLLETERTDRINNNIDYKIDEVEEKIAWKLLGGRPVKSQKKLEDYFLSNPKEHEKFSETLAKVQSVNGKLLGGIAYTEDPQVLYHLTNVKPEKSNKNTALALGIAGLTIGAAVAAYLGIVRPQQEQDKRIKPLTDIGLTREHAISFDNKHMDWAPYNQSVVNFALIDSKYPSLSDYSLNTYKNIRDIPIVSLCLKNQTLAEGVIDNVYRDNRVHARERVINLNSELFEDLNLRSLTMPSIHAFGNYSVVLSELNYPRHSNADLWLLGNATEKSLGSDLVNFDTVVLTGTDGGKVTWVCNIPREVYCLVTHLHYTPDVVNNPDCYESLNCKIKQEDFVLYDKLGQNPLDTSIWEDIRIPNWNYHWGLWKEGKSSLPLDKSSMSQTVPDKTDREVVWRGMWMPMTMAKFDIKTGEYNWQNPNIRIVKDNMEMIKSGVVYDRIMQAYNNPNSEDYNKARFFYTSDLNWCKRSGRWEHSAEMFEKYDEILKLDARLDKLRFINGLATNDNTIEKWGYHMPEQYRVFLMQLYAKSLGDVVYVIDVYYPNSPSIGHHEFMFSAVPVNIASIYTNNPQTYGTPVFGPGKALSFVYCEKNALNADYPSSYKIRQILPTDEKIVIAYRN